MAETTELKGNKLRIITMSSRLKQFHIALTDELHVKLVLPPLFLLSPIFNIMTLWIVGYSLKQSIQECRLKQRVYKVLKRLSIVTVGNSFQPSQISQAHALHMHIFTWLPVLSSTDLISGALHTTEHDIVQVSSLTIENVEHVTVECLNVN